jgi:bacterioferritin-associated ferredoxin
MEAPREEPVRRMIVCSCNVISETDIERALIEIMSVPVPPLPTPGVVYKHLSRRMRCCGCAPLAIDLIYDKMEQLERRGLICPAKGKSMRGQLIRMSPRRGPDFGRLLAAE